MCVTGLTVDSFHAHLDSAVRYPRRRAYQADMLAGLFKFYTDPPGPKDCIKLTMFTYMYFTF
jgi:hypothetical protein